MIKDADSALYVLGTVQEVQAQQAPLILQRTVARTLNSGQLGPVLEYMKPWFATLNLAISPMHSA